MELAGHKCIGFCEYDNFAVASYTSMHCITEEQRQYLSTLPLKDRQKEILKPKYRNGEWYAKDIREVTGENIPRADVWGFGSPCQDFSIAGIRKGLDGDRSSLIREVYRIISEIPEADRPKYLVYENVKGMLSSNGGWDYAAILVEMAELGYDVYFQNFNSKYYGVLQNRERIYTIGCLRTKCSEKVFSFSGSDEKDNLEGMNPKCLGGFGEQNSNGGTQFYQQDRIYDSHTVATSLTNDLPGGSNYYAIDVDSSNQIGHIETENRDNPQRHRVYDVNKAGPTLNTYGGGGQLPEIPVKVDLGDSKQQIIPMNQDCEHQGQLVHNPNGLCSTIRAVEYKDAQKVGIPISVATPPISDQHNESGLSTSI